MKLVLIGFGYLAQAFAAQFHKKYTFTITARSQETIGRIRALGHSPLQWPQEPLPADTEAILIATAPSKQDSYTTSYLALSQTVLSKLRSFSHPPQVIHISSSSVYGDHAGAFVDESSPLKNSSEQGRVLIQTEKNYLSLSHTCILRLGQIIGPGRELEKFIDRVGAQPFGNGNTPCNLSHIDDICSAIDFVLKKDLRGIYNVCWPQHPTRKELYEMISASPLVWQDNLPKQRKSVSPQKIIDEGFTFSPFPYPLGTQYEL